MLAFITVGSTRFDALVHAVLTDDVLDSLHRRGYDQIVIQCGNSDLESPLVEEINQRGSKTFVRNTIDIEIWRFKPSLDEVLAQADLVISHAGSGTILDVLRLGKSLIVVPNPTLLDDHQTELAIALQDLGHLKASTAKELAETIANLDTSKIVPFPPFEPGRFRDLMDRNMGFL